MQASNSDDGNQLPVKFDRLLVIVGGGDVDLDLLKRLHKEGAAIVAADGGAQYCSHAQIIPDAIIGDMDSLENIQDWEQRTRLIKIPEQDTTDFEKCLYATKSDITIALGVAGKRLDHTLAAVDALARVAEKRKILLIDEVDLVLAKTGKFCFRADAGARISVHPVRQVTFSYSKGLEYSLDDLTLEPARRTGISNRAITGAFEIVPAPGNDAPYLVMMDKKYVNDLLRGLAKGTQE